MNTSEKVWALIGVIVVGGIILLVAFLMQGSASPSEGQAAALAVAADDRVKGATSSPVVLVEYLDFECEGCGAFYPLVKQLEAEFGDRVTFVARYFPLQSHMNAVPAALAAEAAGRQGKFWEMHDLLFTRQKEWSEKQVKTPEVFDGYAQELGLNMEQFRADVASPEVLARVTRDRTSGLGLGVQSTPTFFLNGERIRPQNYDQFKALITSKL